MYMYTKIIDRLENLLINICITLKLTKLYKEIMTERIVAAKNIHQKVQNCGGKNFY